MNKIILFLLFTALLFGQAVAQKINYDVSLIPDSLTEKAEAVIRNYNHEFEIHSKSRATEKVHLALTVLKRKAIEKTILHLQYNDLTKYRQVKGKIYNSKGEKIKDFDFDDIRDISLIENSSLFSDARVLYYDPEYEDIPFTFEVSYTRKFDGLLNLPSWQPHNDFDVSVESAQFKVIHPKDLDIRHKTQNFNGLFLENDNIYQWKITNSKAIASEPYSKNKNQILPSVFLAPTKFSMEGWEGEIKNWNTLGKWDYDLFQSSQTLNQKKAEIFKHLTEDKANDREKIETLYDYLQNNTRYLNIAVGIGGWKPQDVSFTHEQGIGDCKALTSYMYAMLDAVGIRSIYTSVYAGENAPDIDVDFPSNHFNHVILCVPQEKDTIWLECTSQNNPMGHVGNFTDDRHVLLHTENGGEIAKTPVYDKKYNQIVTKATFKLDEAGKGEVEIQNTYSGNKFDNAAALFYSTDEKAKKKYLYKLIDIPDYIINSYNHKAIEQAKVPTIEENISATVNNYGVKMGNMLFVPVNLLSKISTVPPKLDKRKNDVFIRRSYIYTDTIIYTIPEGFKVKHLPENEKISCDIACYSSSTTEKNGNIIYVRNYEKNKGTYPPDTYEKVRQFFKDVSKADAQKIVFEKIN
ncbi:MAG: hypothetical protein C0599_11620 [Salinivirgaceae bacterium]|nr:MAG: hypothetical protein C0599_11620 [Salinivirgaceae bacterium]